MYKNKNFKIVFDSFMFIKKKIFLMYFIIENNKVYSGYEVCV